MSEENVHCGDNNVENLIADHRERVKKGTKKYGVTTDRTDYSLRDWLQHALEESMDLSVYLKRSVAKLDANESANKVPVTVDPIIQKKYSELVDGKEVDTLRGLLLSEVEMLFGYGSLWGGALCIYEFQHSGPSRSGKANISVVCHPNTDSQGNLVTVVYAHHEGSDSHNLKDFIEPLGDQILKKEDPVEYLQYASIVHIINQIIEHHYSGQGEEKYTTCP